MKKLLGLLALLVFLGWMLCCGEVVFAQDITMTAPLVVLGDKSNHGQTDLVLTEDTDYALTSTDASHEAIVVTSTVSLTADHTLVAPLVKGKRFSVENLTSGGHALRVCGASGACSSYIANGSSGSSWSDGAKYIDEGGGGGSGNVSGQVANHIPYAGGPNSITGSSPMIVDPDGSICGGSGGAGDVCLKNNEFDALALAAQNYAPATSSANQDGGGFGSFGNFWNGTASQVDGWTGGLHLGTGTNPTTTFTIQHHINGSSGYASISLLAPTYADQIFARDITGSVQCVHADSSGHLTGTGADCGSGSGGGVTTFNTRSGAVTLSSSDVTTALGGTPVLSLTTTGTSGAATLTGSVLNIPQYGGGTVGGTGDVGSYPCWTAGSTLGNCYFDYNVTNAGANTSTKPLYVQDSTHASATTYIPTGVAPGVPASGASLGIDASVTTPGAYMLPDAPCDGFAVWSNASGKVKSGCDPHWSDDGTYLKASLPVELETYSDIHGSHAGLLISQEGDATGGVSGLDMMWASSLYHRWVYNDSGATGIFVGTSGGGAAGNCAMWTSGEGTAYTIEDAGAPCGSGGSGHITGSINPVSPRSFATVYHNTNAYAINAHGIAINNTGSAIGDVTVLYGSTSTPVETCWTQHFTATTANSNQTWSCIVPADDYYEVSVSGDFKGTPGAWFEDPL